MYLNTSSHISSHTSPHRASQSLVDIFIFHILSHILSHTLTHISHLHSQIISFLIPLLISPLTHFTTPFHRSELSSSNALNRTTSSAAGGSGSVNDANGSSAIAHTEGSLLDGML